jgi:hypothetical protein
MILDREDASIMLDKIETALFKQRDDATLQNIAAEADHLADLTGRTILIFDTDCNELAAWNDQASEPWDFRF